MPYCISLNKATLLFFPSKYESPAIPLSSPHVVQVMIKQARQAVIDELSVYFLHQHDITKAIEALLLTDLCAPLPLSPTESVEITGEGYILRGVRKPWEYGTRLTLEWGKERVCLGEDKWVFSFEVEPGSVE